MVAAGQGVPAEVELAEHLGDISVLHVRVQGIDGLLSAKVGAGHAHLDAGQTIGLVPDPAWTLAFDENARLIA